MDLKYLTTVKRIEIFVGIIAICMAALVEQNRLILVALIILLFVGTMSFSHLTRREALGLPSRELPAGKTYRVMALYRENCLEYLFVRDGTNPRLFCRDYHQGGLVIKVGNMISMSSSGKLEILS